MKTTTRVIARTGHPLLAVVGALALLGLGACGGKGTSNNNNQEPFCGNGVVDATELCDGSDLAGATCEGLNLGTGDLACTDGCTFDVSGCLHQAECGNGVREYPETCDGTDLGSTTCEDMGYVGGLLACGEDCELDISGCSTCGNDIIDGEEQCDGPDLGGASCESLGLGEGDLACTDGCTLDTSGCLDCDETDETPPEASSHEPAPETLGALADTSVSVVLFDACGIDVDTITMELNICGSEGLCNPAFEAVTPMISGTGTQVTVGYQHSADFPEGGVVTVRVTAEDVSGNLLEESWRFSVQEELVLHTSTEIMTSLVNAISEASPNQNSPGGFSYDVDGTVGSERRMIIRFTPDVPDGAILAARLDLGICWILAPDTPDESHIDCYRLNVESSPTQASWNRRLAGTSWTQGGAEAVPEDREGTPAATLIPGIADPFSYLTADVVPLVLDWQGGEGYHGILCRIREEAMVPLCSTASNAPPRIVLTHGPSLP